MTSRGRLESSKTFTTGSTATLRAAPTGTR